MSEPPGVFVAESFGRCPVCDASVGLMSRSESDDPIHRGSHEHYVLWCPTHGDLGAIAAAPCPACGSARSYESFGRGIVAYCWACRATHDARRRQLGAEAVFGDLMRRGLVRRDGTGLTPSGRRLHKRLESAAAGTFVWAPKDAVPGRPPTDPAGADEGEAP